MTRKIGSSTENSPTIHNAVLKGPLVTSKISNEEVFENKSKETKLISNHMKHDFERVRKQNSSDDKKTCNLHSLQPDSSVMKMKNNLKKLTEELNGKNLYITGRQKKSSKLIRPYGIVKLPYGCIWSGKEGRFAIRVFSPKLKNGETKS